MQKNCSKSELLSFFRQLQALLKAGLPIIKALQILKTETNKRLADKLGMISQNLQFGNSLAVSFYEAGFPAYDTNLIRIGEENGDIQESFNRIITYREKAISSHEKIKKALMYPLIVLAMSFLSIVFMLVFIIPAFCNIFSEFNCSLPPITRLVLNISGNWPAIVISPAIIFASLYFFIRKDRVKIQLPVFGKIYKNNLYVNICRSLGCQLLGGVPLLKGLSTITAGLKDQDFKKALLLISTSLQNGEKLSDSLRMTGKFPEALLQIIKVGEESGSLGGVLIQAADFYEQECDGFIKKAITLVEPLSTLLVGGVVGLVAFSMILPLFSLMESIK